MRKLAVIPALLALLLVACTSGGDGTNERQDEAIEQPGAAAAAPTSVTEPAAVPEPKAEPSEEEDSALGELLNPLNLLSGSLFSGAGPAGLRMATGEADPALKAALITLDDLPPGYDVLDPGEMSFSFETDEGSLSVAMAMFFQGDVGDAFPESMLISAVITGSGDLLDESLGELQRYTESGDLEQEIEEALGPGGLGGIGFEDVQVLDASDLGDGGVGLHMVITMELDELGLPMPSDGDFMSEGIAFDMYVFGRGDHLLMLMSIWPGTGARAVDARALAELMDGRAEDAF